MQPFSSIILYMYIVCIAQWLSDADAKILHGYGAFEQRLTLFKP